MEASEVSALITYKNVIIIKKFIGLNYGLITQGLINFDPK